MLVLRNRIADDARVRVTAWGAVTLTSATLPHEFRVFPTPTTGAR
jgi:hypothetical protein